MANREDFVFGSLSNSLARTRISKEYAYQGLNFSTDDGTLRGRSGYLQIGARSGAHANDVAYGAEYGKWSGNEVQKLTVTGTPTGGTVKLTWTYNATTYSSTATLAYNATASDVYAYLQTLANTGVFAFKAGDINVTGGPFPGDPVLVEFTGRYANIDVALFVLGTNSLTGGTSPSLTIEEKKKGGTSEVIYVVLKKNGDTDSNLYAVTSSDGFLTTTWTSLATNFDSSDWFLKQYQDRMFMANSVDGLKYVYIGASAVSADPPSPPAVAPTFGGPFENFEGINLGTGCSYAQTGFASAPTMAANSGGIKVTTAAVESGRSVVITITLAADIDLSSEDVGDLFFSTAGITILPQTLRVSFINADGSPVTINPVAYETCYDVGVGGAHGYYRHWQLAGEQRYSRDNIHKVVLSFTFDTAASGAIFYVYANNGSNWMNDTLALVMGPPPAPTSERIKYGMTYYRASDGVESAMSPIGESPSVPTQLMGSYLSVNGYGSTELSSSDRQYFYRQDANGDMWRIPNLWTKNGGYSSADYGVDNDPTGVSDGQYDHWMAYELERFPKYEQRGFPPISTGKTSDVLGVWKQSLIVGSGQLVYLSWKGDPVKFEPPPDTPLYTPPDPDLKPDQGVTEYLSDNRAEPVLCFAGQDALYGISALSSYAKIGDNPLESSVFRRLPGSRGTVGKRAACPYGGGISVGSQDGWWFYSVGRGFRGEDNGDLNEREETLNVRQSYRRLLSDLHKLTISGSAGTFTLTFDSQTTAAIARTASAADIQAALEALSNINPGDVEVFGADFPSGTIYIRFVGQYARSDAGTFTALGSGGITATLTEISAGGDGTDLVVFEFNDELWAIHHKNYLTNSRNKKWFEGAFADSIKCAIANRERGPILVTTTGKLMKMGPGYTTDNGTAIPWLYETGILIGARTQLMKTEVHVDGAPTLSVRSEDGAAGSDSRTITLGSDRVKPHNDRFQPGFRARILFTGVAGTDVIHKITLIDQPAGTNHGG